MIASVNHLKDVGNDEEILSPISSVNCMVVNQIQDDLGNFFLVQMLHDGSGVLLEVGDEGKFELISRVDFGNEIITHEVHVLNHLENQFCTLHFQFLLAVHFRTYLVHEIHKLQQILDPQPVLAFSVFQKCERFLQFPLQVHYVGFEQFVDGFLRHRDCGIL